MDNPVIIFGANSLGRSAKEIFESNGVVVYGFLDDNQQLHGKELDEAAILGSTDDDGFLKLIGKKCEAFVAIDETKVRKVLVKMLLDNRHIQPVNAIHTLSTISQRASLGHGNFIDVHVVLSPASQLGSHNIIQAGSYIGPEAKLGDFVQVGAGTRINSAVTIENDVFIGSGVTIIAGVTIGAGSRIGAGSVVIGHVKAGETIFGNPAQPVKSA